MRKALLLASAAALLTTAPCAFAAEPMTMEEMQKQLEALTQQVQKLSSVVEEQDKIIRQQSANLENQDAKLMEQGEKLSRQSAVVENLAAITPAAGGDDKEAVKITMAPGPKIESADGQYSFQPFGRVHMDYTIFDDDDGRDHPNGADFRRARMGFKGDLGEDFEYKFEMDFAREGVAIKEATLTYTALDQADLVLGHFKPMLGMEQGTSSNYIQFLERSSPINAFTRGEHLGFGARGGGDNWSLAAGIFNEDVGNNNATDDEAWSVDARGSVDLLAESENVLHLGAGASYRVPTARLESVTYAARVTGVGNNLVSTGAINNVDNETVYGGELAGVFGPLSFQGEYFYSDLELDGGAAGSDPDFDGWYAQAGYFLTGESRPYKGDTGNFNRVKPQSPFSLKDGTWGAFELVARYDELDLNDGGAGVAGGAMETWTGGVNWYLTNHIRLMADVVAVDTDNNAVVANDDPEILNLRAQWDF